MSLLPGAGDAPLRGLLVTFEGPEGSGKTTLIRSLAAVLAERGCEAVLLREPGGTEIGERIRNILLDHASREMCAETELLLMEASRAQLVRERVVPALEAGLVILCDRFADASLAYQGFGRGLGEKAVQRFNDFATGDLEPDLTFLCLLPPEEGRERLKHRKQDRLDREDMAFHQRVYEGYLSLAASGRPRLVTLDARETPEAMVEAALGHLARLEHGLLKFL
jgi:dTMP kinase